MPTLRTILISFLLGTLATILVAWSCILWTPVRHITGGAAWELASQPDTTDPDGEIGIHSLIEGFGWTDSCLVGQRDKDNPSQISWKSPYWGVYHRTAGWPLAALRSRVEVLDGGPWRDGEPMPPPPRRRWQLPWREILYRGIASKDLPAFLHVQPDRRVPLIPMFNGFVQDTLLYAAIFFVLISLLAPVFRRLLRLVRGEPKAFPVIVQRE